MKKIFFTVLCFVLLNKVSAQADKVILDNVFQNINKATIPTGYLQDYGVAFAVAGVFHRQHFKLRVDVRLRVKRIKNPILFVIQHALRNMSNSLLEPSSRPSCNEGEICLKVGQLFCFCSVYSLFF